MSMLSRGPQIDEFLKDLFLVLENTCDIVFFSHENMDPDAIGSIIGMIGFLEASFASKFNYLVFPPRISKLSRKVIDALQFNISTIETIPSTDFLPILVDSQNISNVIKNDEILSKSLQERSIIIDHHFAESSLTYRFGYIDSTSQSACEIIQSFFQARAIEPVEPFNRALLAGILYDSGFLKYAQNSTVHAVDQLLGTDFTLNDIRQMLNDSMDLSERIARLKAGIRCNLTKIGETVIATSEVSTFEASACRGLIGLGADIAMVLAQNKGEVRISARQTDDCHVQHGLNLAVIMQAIAPVIGGSGGGHELAAAANGTKDGAEGLKKAIKLIEQELG
ncbi:MAG TPA: DHHA1 domain-containing protein [Candidatus Lokiarchaeia archaeon]|nr:DHHA1 domain-containing protein [Candidatus Lokiarchaeia archaeon]